MSENKLKKTEKEIFNDDVVIGNITNDINEEPENEKENLKSIENEKNIDSAQELKVSFIDHLLGGRFLANKKAVKQIPFALYLTTLAMLYIANNNYAEKTIRKIELTKKEIKELRSEHIFVKSELNRKSGQSEIARQLEESGLKESVVPPQKIFVDLNEIKALSGESIKKK